MNSKSRELIEGNRYSFLVEKLLKMPDGESSFVLIGPGNRKFLIPVVRYLKYGIVVGKEIICRVDKINCKGEVFLEPVNPWYKENTHYQFEVIEYREMNFSRIRQGRVMMVKSLTGDVIPVPVPAGKELPEPGSIIRLLVQRISKGQLHLAFKEGQASLEHLETDVDYEFVVTDTETDIDGEEYFIVADQLGVNHIVKKRYYEYYGLRVGVKFRGRIVKYIEDGSKMIEPENPFYTPGQLLEIDVARKEKNRADGSYYIAGTDRFGQLHEFRTDSRINSEKILARVLKIRKGKPLLQLVV